MNKKESDRMVHRYDKWIDTIQKEEGKTYEEASDMIIHTAFSTDFERIKDKEDLASRFQVWLTTLRGTYNFVVKDMEGNLE